MSPTLLSAEADAWTCLGGTWAPPPIQVVEQADLTCRNSPDTIPSHMTGFGCGNARFHAAPSTPCVCQAGNADLRPIPLAREAPPLEPFHEMALVHEYLHVRLRQETGDPDINHAGPAWGKGGDRERCDTKLERDGF